ncbi:MFS transporter [Chloroflexota bacterium]
MKMQSTAEDNREEAYRFRWAVLILLFFLQTSASLVVLSFGPLAPFLQEDLNISRTQVGMFTSAVYASQLFLGLICGWLVDRFGVRRFLLLGPGIIGLFFIALSKTPSFGIALILVFLGGAGYVFINPSAAKALAYWFSPRTRATAIGIMKSGVALGGAIGGAVLPVLALMLGWRSALTSAAVAVIIFGALAVTVYRESPKSPSVEAPAFGLKELGRVVTNRSILLLGGAGAAYSAIQLSLLTYLVLFLKEVVLLPVVMAGTYLTVVGLSGIAGRILWSVISDRVFGGRRKVVLVTIGFITGIMALSTAFLATASPRWLLYIMMAIFGFAATGWTAVFITFVAELAGREQAATGVGLGLTLVAMGIVFGPPLFGYIVDTTHSYTIAWTVFGILAAIGGALMILIREPS